MRRWRSVFASAGIACALAACAGREASSTGVYHSRQGYRVILPGADWERASDSRADLELRHREARAGMLVNASCDPRLTERTVSVLGREMLAGFSAREVQEEEATSVVGREATHVVMEGQRGPGRDRMRVELFVVRGERCIYDLLYVAAPADFTTWRGDFRQLVETFALE